jgi:toxin ParE1/3/4
MNGEEAEPLVPPAFLEACIPGVAGTSEVIPAIHHTYRARRDLMHLWLHMREKCPAAADRFLQRIEARLDILRHSPKAGARRPDLARDARMLVAPPYLILYRILPEGVQIVRVVHGARRLGRALFRAGFRH